MLALGGLLVSGGLVGGAEDEDVGDWGSVVVGGHLLCVFKDGGWGFRVGASEVAVVGLIGFLGDCGEGNRGYLGLFGLLEGLGEGCLTGPWGATVWPDLCPAFAEKIAELPTSLHR